MKKTSPLIVGIVIAIVIALLASSLGIISIRL